VSDINTVVVDSLKELDPEWPIREAEVIKIEPPGEGDAHQPTIAFVKPSFCVPLESNSGARSMRSLAAAPDYDTLVPGIREALETAPWWLRAGINCLCTAPFTAAWRRRIALVEALPADQAALFWQAVIVPASANLAAQSITERSPNTGENFATIFRLVPTNWVAKQDSTRQHGKAKFTK
jgi:hypothetical protein